MRVDRKPGRLMGWVSAAIVAVLMIATFALVGGLGSVRGTASPAVRVSYAHGDDTGIQSISIANSCASAPTISGTVLLTRSYWGSVTLGLFFLSQSPHNDFWDTGRRATATFSGSSSAPYTFSSFVPVPGSPAYIVKVVHASSGLDVPDYFTHSLAVPVCQVVTATKTNTTTATTTQTNTRTTTQTNTVTSTSTRFNTTTVQVPTTTTAFVTGTTTVQVPTTTTAFVTGTTTVQVPTTILTTIDHTATTTEFTTVTYSVTYVSSTTETTTTTTTDTVTSPGITITTTTVTTINPTTTIPTPL
jgi:hypothetical protein